MNRRQIHAGELFGIVLILCIAVDLIVRLWIKAEVLRIPFLWSNGWISGFSIASGMILLVVGCVGGYISHERFNQAVSPEGNVRYILKSGLFKLVRHPFYLSLILITLSFVLMLRSYILLTGLIVVATVLVGAARKEEMQLIETFGEEYLDYQQKTGMFFLIVFRKSKHNGQNR